MRSEDPSVEVVRQPDFKKRCPEGVALRLLRLSPSRVARQASRDARGPFGDRCGKRHTSVHVRPQWKRIASLLRKVDNLARQRIAAAKNVTDITASLTSVRLQIE